MFYLEIVTQLVELLVDLATLANFVGEWRGPCGPLPGLCSCLVALSN
tara:strand:+ start:1009 stop:1149 length:141 start_codon:yes stop_codon:yes gene_type:complete